VDQTTGDELGPELPQLHVVITRLKEIQRHCAAFHTRSDEFALMEERVAETIAALERVCQTGSSPRMLSSLASGLLPVERLFETSGFINVARVVAQAAQTLSSLYPGTEAPAGLTDTLGSIEATAPRPTSASAGTTPEPADTSPPPRITWPLLACYMLCGGFLAHALGHHALGVDRPVMVIVLAALGLALGFAVGRAHAHIMPLLRMGRDQKALGIMLVALLLAPTLIGGALGLLLFVTDLIPGSHHPMPQQPAAASSEQIPTPPAVPTTPPQASLPRSSPPGTTSESLTASIGKAREALQAGDLATTSRFLNRAALIDADDSLVLDTAASLLRATLEQARKLLDQAQWSACEQQVQAAHELALRFRLDLAPITELERELATTARYRDIELPSADTLRSAVGSWVVITLDNGEEVKGVLQTVQPSRLVVRLTSTVAGGEMDFVKELALSEISSIRVYPDDQPPGSDSSSPE